ncbi:hypothetical protein G6F35_015623 [Rhizopus arrhizus]|nr:hypothetical protein G6F35_015623 [Rhizopus arrhizus]
MQVYGLRNVYVIGDTVDLPVSKAGGSCHNQAPVIANNIAGEIRLGHPCSVYEGRVQAVAQMGLNAGMPLWYDYTHDVQPTPPTKLGGLLRHGFNRGLYWAPTAGQHRRPDLADFRPGGSAGPAHGGEAWTAVRTSGRRRMDGRQQRARRPCANAGGSTSPQPLGPAGAVA